MRAPNNKRARGRSNRRAPNPNRSYESHGADVKIRGNASQVYEKYCSLARDASSSGDPIAAEGYWQHAEHYFRIMQTQQNNQQNNRNQQRDAGAGEQPKQSQPEEAATEDSGNQPTAQAADNSATQDEQPAEADAAAPVAEEDTAGVERAVRRGRPRRAPRRSPKSAPAEEATQPVAEVESAAE